jgi:hypothetical protein
MPLPANVTTVTVLGTFLTPEGNPSTGTITFTPSSWLTNSGANVAIPNSPTTKTLGTAGNFSVLLPITDDPDLSPDNWVYNVSEVVDGVSQNYNILLPGTVAVGGTVFLADLVPAAPAGPEYYSLASSLTIGTVTTVATGGSATASITGLAPSQVLNLGIPTGATGTITTAGSGSVGTATVAPPGDPDTGIYFPAANQVGITTGGSAAAIFAAGAISNPTFTGVASFPDGSASAPSITNTGDTNTGIYFAADDTVGITTAGTARVTVNSSGNVGIGTSPGTILHTSVNGAGSIQLLDGAAAANEIRFRRYNSTVASPTVVADGNVLGAISFQGYDGAAMRTAAQIAGVVNGAPGASDMPGALTFATTADGGISTTEKMRIDSNGLITGTGTSLGAWTAYTPTLGGTGWAIGDGTITGAYCQIGKLIFFRAQVDFGSTSTYGASAEPTLTGPANVKAGIGGNHDLSAVLADTSLGLNYVGLVRTTASSPLTFTISALGTSSVRVTANSTTPFTWASTDRIQITGFVEAA